jgi:hypothetical protein
MNRKPFTYPEAFQIETNTPIDKDDVCRGSIDLDMKYYFLWELLKASWYIHTPNTPTHTTSSLTSIYSSRKYTYR